jgi:hypothetical protein
LQLTAPSSGDVPLLISSTREAMQVVEPENVWPLRPVDSRVARAESAIGAAAPMIERLPFDLSVLDEGGVFVNVDARNFGLLDRRLDWQTLGIALPKDTDLAFRAPTCGLVPDKYRLPLLRPAAQAHSALHKYSYRFQLVETVFETPSYRWLPWQAWPEFERSFAAAGARLQAALDRYERDFALITESTVSTFERLAVDSSRRLSATGEHVGDLFVDTVIRSVQAALPAPDLLRQQLTLRFRIGVIQLGSELWAEQRKAAEQRRLTESSHAEARLEQCRLAAHQRIVQEELWTSQERLRQQRAAEEEERRREASIKEQLRQLKLQAARERLNEALSPLQEGAQQLHTVVFDAATAIRASLQKHQALRGASARRARNLCKWFALMNWTGDEQLERLITELEQLATAPSKGKRDPKPIDQVLGDIIATTYANARELAEPNRMAALEL